MQKKFLCPLILFSEMVSKKTTTKHSPNNTQQIISHGLQQFYFFHIVVYTAHSPDGRQ
jgi:hypothetical protein